MVVAVFTPLNGPRVLHYPGQEHVGVEMNVEGGVSRHGRVARSQSIIGVARWGDGVDAHRPLKRAVAHVEHSASNAHVHVAQTKGAVSAIHLDARHGQSCREGQPTQGGVFAADGDALPGTLVLTHGKIRLVPTDGEMAVERRQLRRLMMGEIAGVCGIARQQKGQWKEPKSHAADCSAYGAKRNPYFPSRYAVEHSPMIGRAERTCESRSTASQRYWATQTPAARHTEFWLAQSFPALVQSARHAPL